MPGPKDETSIVDGTSATDAGTTPESTTTAAGGEAQTTEQTTEQTAAAAATAAEKTAPELPAWVTPRIDTLTRKLREAEEARLREVTELQRQLTELAAGQPVGQQPTAQQIHAEAQRIAAEQAFNDRCSAVAEQGKKDFPDFNAQIGKFQQIGGLPPSMLQAVVEVDAPQAVLYELSKDLDEAYRISQMSPLRQAAALAKMGVKLAAASAKATPAATPTAGASARTPDAIDGTVVGRGRTAPVRLDDERVSMRDWMEARQAQLAKKRA